MSTDTKRSFPLAWPDGWPRTKHRTTSRFTRSNTGGSYASRFHSMNEATTLLANELRRLRATKEVLSTNIKVRLDGSPYSNQAQPADPGAAVYFELDKKPVALACDKWTRVEDNVWAIAKHIEAMRAQDRWGVGSIARAFTGYLALPAVGESGASQWWNTLGVTINATPDQVREAYRILVRKHHPDTGGDPELFLRVQKAMDVFETLQRQTQNP